MYILTALIIAIAFKLMFSAKHSRVYMTKLNIKCIVIYSSF